MGAAQRRLDAASGRLDAAGAHLPPEGDLGLAAPVVLTLLAAHTETSARLISESRMLSWGIGLYASEMSDVDAQAALDLIRLGTSDGHPDPYRR